MAAPNPFELVRGLIERGGAAKREALETILQTEAAFAVVACIRAMSWPEVPDRTQRMCCRY